MWIVQKVREFLLQLQYWINYLLYYIKLKKSKPVKKAQKS